MKFRFFHEETINSQYTQWMCNLHVLLQSDTYYGELRVGSGILRKDRVFVVVSSPYKGGQSLCIAMGQ